MVEGDILRVKITAVTESPAAIPFNYNYALHSAIYGLIEKSSGEYSEYFHDKGFINEAVKRRFKLFTFLKLFLRLQRFKKPVSAGSKRSPSFFQHPLNKVTNTLSWACFQTRLFT
jgi:CRISPR-associated endoribonuclease Cas6